MSAPFHSEIISGPYGGTECAAVRFLPCPGGCAGCTRASSFERSHVLVPLTPAEDIALKASDQGVKDVLLLGESVLMWQSAPAFVDLVAHLGELECRVHVETGLREDIDASSEIERSISQFMIRPAIGPTAAVEDVAGRRLKMEAIPTFKRLARGGRAHFLIYAKDLFDVWDTAVFVAAHEIRPELVWVEPQAQRAASVATTKADRARTQRIVDAAVAEGFQITKDEMRHAGDDDGS
ncbi:hypothetical protein ACFC1T_09525 [Kitasatospora sp. NPDC056076]|uniref:hypothetical protein n=1 Tax=Kitasatospora sp. NPDC056076 TaxID=3345703 RepID=UPI0035D92E3E